MKGQKCNCRKQSYKEDMNTYELKKIQVEYKRVNAAKEEQELRILEFQEQIKRLEASIEVSVKKEEELLSKIKAMENEK